MLTVLCASCATVAPVASPSGSGLTPTEVASVVSAMTSRVRAGGPNHLHMRRLFFMAPAFASAAGAQLDVVQAAALLHDSTKENGEGNPKDRFCTHGEQGARVAELVITPLGRPAAFASQVARAIREHMGPCGTNTALHDARFMTKFCARDFPSPSSPEAKVLFDIDMLDLMTVDGMVKVVELRQKNAEFAREPLQASALTGADSAWKSVLDAQQTLQTPAAQRCGEALATHSRGFLDSLDWNTVTSMEQFRAAAQRFKQQTPLPPCLPIAPECETPECLGPLTR